jgi:hypothetical protein
MKIIKITLIIIFISALINAVRLGDDYPIVQALPFLGRGRPLIYHIAGIAVLLITAWGLHRLRKNRKQKNRSNTYYSGYWPRPGSDPRYRDYFHNKY